jgi:hypothetical protein
MTMKHPVITLPTRPTTVRGWLETLPEPYRSQAIENCTWPDDECDSQRHAIVIAFVWDGSPQGDEHWLDVSLQSVAGLFPYEFSDEMKEGEK